MHKMQISSSYKDNLKANGGMVPCIFNLGTRWRQVVSLTPRSL